MFIFVLQGLWLYISELAGKDLDTLTTIKFIFYSSPRLIPLVVPLTVLLASIMVFGNFAENYEFAAMKSTGISLQRAMRSLTIFIVALGFGCFFFANNAIPWGEFNFYNLRRNIAKVKPALAIAEGQFNEIGNLNIKVDKKSGERGQNLENVIIHKKKGFKNGNYTVIVAETGELISSEDSNILKLELKNGNYYDELITKDVRKFVQRKPHAQSSFKTYVINVDLGNLYTVDMDSKDKDDKYSMLDVNDLNYVIDSLNVSEIKSVEKMSDNLYSRSSFKELSDYKLRNTDSLFEGDVLDLFNTKKKIQILSLAQNKVTSTTQILFTNQRNMATQASFKNRYIIALHEKYALGFACVILFFVGAPLGALIRKGGIGLPMVVAILLFLTYHFIGLFIKNSAKNDNIDPVLGTWLSTLIMLPLSIYLTNRATNDKGPINIDTDKVLKPLITFFKLKKKASTKKQVLDENSEDYQTLIGFDASRLKQIVKDHRDFDYTVAHKNSALNILYDRGATQQELKLGGYLTSTNEDGILSSKNKYIEYSNLSFILYGFMASLSVLGGVLMNNKFPTLGLVLYILGGISLILFLMALSKSFAKHEELNVLLGKPKSTNAVFYGLVGFPLYFIFYFIQKRNINHYLKRNYKSALDATSKEVSVSISEKSQQFLQDFKDYSNTSLVSFVLAIILFAVYLIGDKEKNSQITEASLQLGYVALLFFVIYLITEVVVYRKFKNSLDITSDTKNQWIPFVVIPIYPLRYFLLRNHISKIINKEGE